MSETPGDRPDPAFVRELRRALWHLYDPDVLRKNPLLELLPVGDPKDPLALQRMLTAAIEALRPETGVSPQSNAARTHHILWARYTQQYRQGEVARALGLSLRHIRRQESLALRTLAQYLWKHYDLQHRTQDTPLVSQTAPTPLVGAISREHEMHRLEQSSGSEPLAVARLVNDVIKTIAPLAHSLDVHIESTVTEDLSPILAQKVSMRQALLNILTAAVLRVPCGRVEVSAVACGQQVDVRIRLIASQGPVVSLASNEAEAMEMARQLAGLSHGLLQAAPDAEVQGAYVVSLSLPAAEQALVLVIDDNTDALQLYERYLEGSRYAFRGTHDPTRALALAERLAPHIILLDVMLPGVDGWELLGRLREHPRIRHIPIIVCTILPQEHLALALGADAFLRKPVSREDFLAALDRQLGQLSPEPH